MPIDHIARERDTPVWMSLCLIIEACSFGKCDVIEDSGKKPSPIDKINTLAKFRSDLITLVAILMPQQTWISPQTNPRNLAQSVRATYWINIPLIFLFQSIPAILIIFPASVANFIRGRDSALSSRHRSQLIFTYFAEDLEKGVDAPRRFVGLRAHCSYQFVVVVYLRHCRPPSSHLQPLCRDHGGPVDAYIAGPTTEEGS